MINIKNLTVGYDRKKVLDAIDLTLPQGSNIGIIGPNGAGKSTLIKALLGLVFHSSGKITINNQDYKKYRHNIAYVPQKSEIDMTFPITVGEVVSLGTIPKLKLFQRITSKQKNIAYEAMKLVEIDEFEHVQISKLSGGQLQRVFIARALAQQADIYLLDEPFIGIDMVSEKIIIEILHKLVADNKTVIVVHHDLKDVDSYFDQLLILGGKRVIFGDINEVFTHENIAAAYGTSFESNNYQQVGVSNA